MPSVGLDLLNHRVFQEGHSILLLFRKVPGHSLDVTNYKEAIEDLDLDLHIHIHLVLVLVLVLALVLALVLVMDLSWSFDFDLDLLLRLVVLV